MRAQQVEVLGASIRPSELQELVIAERRRAPFLFLRDHDSPRHEMVDSTAAWRPGDSGIKPGEDAGRSQYWWYWRARGRRPAWIIRIYPARGVVESTI